MEENEFEDLLGSAPTSERPERGAACRLVGRFAPVQGWFSVDCHAGVTFRSAQRLRQLSVFLCIPTRSILACTTDGCMVSLSVQGMAGRGISFEFNSAEQCCQAALSLATAGQQSEEELDSATEEDIALEGGCSAVLDEVVLGSRFGFALGSGCRLLAWERCLCFATVDRQLSAHGIAEPDPGSHDTQRNSDCAEAQGGAGADAAGSDGHARAAVPGILYVCDSGVVFLPDRFCKCSGEVSLRAVATILPKPKCHSVRQVLGGVEVSGSWLGRHPAPETSAGWAPGTARAVPRDNSVFSLCFRLGLSKDFEALSHAAYGLLEGNEATFLEQQHRQNKGSEAERARGKVWARTYAHHSGHQLRSDPAVRAAILGSLDGGGAGLPVGIPASCRAMMWIKLSGASEMSAAHSPQYAYQLLNGDVGSWGPELEAHMAQAETEISKDINRTFSDSDIRDCLTALGRDRNQPLQWFGPKLKRVLMAFARHNPSIGYCQSLNYIGGLIVIVIEAEEDCFWVLNSLLLLHMPRGYYGDLSGVMIDVEVLNCLLEQHLKAVKDKLQHVHLPLTSFATQWFMCAYVNVLPLASVLKVWDTLLLVGPVLLFRVALALLKAIEGELGLATEMEHAMTALQRARNLEIETVLTIAHVCFGEAVVDLSLLLQLRHQANLATLESPKR